jgi:hypothetical protein
MWNPLVVAWRFRAQESDPHGMADQPRRVADSEPPPLYGHATHFSRARLTELRRLLARDARKRAPKTFHQCRQQDRVLFCGRHDQRASD